LLDDFGSSPQAQLGEPLSSKFDSRLVIKGQVELPARRVETQIGARYDASLLRLVTALLVEQSDQWESEKTYLNMKPENL
jgi:hypothetical protein